ncbi:mRNA-decapping enzyme subunit 2 [Sparganum proliferum]
MAQIPEKISEDTLRLIYSLFINNIPQSVKDEWRTHFVRIFAELELAHWYYLDNCLKDDSVGIDFFGFCHQLFGRFPHLIPKKTNWKEKFQEWKHYRGTTATGSAIILDEYLSMVLLVQGFNNDRWTFPGGKINQNETLQQCAIREVMEETGLDIEHRLDENLFIDACLGETKRRAFIVEGFPRTSRLQPSTRNEIEAITWFNIANLPAHVQDETPMLSMKLKPTMFYCVIPFVKQLRQYVKLRKSGRNCADALSASESPQPATGPKMNRLASTPVMTSVKSSPSVGSPETLLPPAAFNAPRAKSRDSQSPAKTNSKKKRSASSKPSSAQEAVPPPTYHRPPNVVPPARANFPPPSPFCAPTPQLQPAPLPPFGQVTQPPPVTLLPPPVPQSSIPPANMLRSVSSASAFPVPPPPLLPCSTSYSRPSTDQLNFLRVVGCGGMEADSLWSNVRLDGEALVNCLAPRSARSVY